MARNTSISLRNSIIYEVYIRNHTKEGNLRSFVPDIERIRSLGTDIVWLMPIHPIGEKNRKGKLGCPYSIKNYKDINPEYGTVDDFKEVINEIHKNNMKVMIDVVYNHTSRDSYLLEKHPEYFYKDSKGNVGNRVGEWYDVIDLDYKNKNLWKDQIEVLKYWAEMGVDGFRCDVASIIPVEFWKEARNEVVRVNNVIWLAESSHPEFIVDMRFRGYEAYSDSEVYNAFDITYDYDIFEYFKGYINGEISLEEYLSQLRRQESIYPANYVKLRFLENHDQKRARKLFKDDSNLKMWTAFMYFQKGAVLLYGGQETRDEKTPSLFEKDTIDWSTYDEEYVRLLKKLGQIKKKKIFAEGNYKIHSAKDTDVIYITYENKDAVMAGIFNVACRKGFIDTDFPDGKYTDLIYDSKFTVKNGKTELKNVPVIFDLKK